MNFESDKVLTNHILIQLSIMNELFSIDIIFSAYRKLKHYFYYDNTSLLIKHRLSKFESENIKGDKLDEIKLSLYGIINPIFHLEANEKYAFFNKKDLLNEEHVSYHLLPKKFKKQAFDFITNVQNERSLELERINIFVDASVEVHLISVLWLMFAGKYLKKEISSDNYAYELQIDENDPEEKVVDGLRLYKPYFLQYQQWRDKAISKAEELIKEKKNVTILSLDVKDYFHTVDISIEVIKREIISIVENKINSSFSDQEKEKLRTEKARIEVLSDLLEKIHLVYSEKIQIIKTNQKENSNPLPIGLMSSGLLGNYYLRNFDNEVIDTLNPSFYGRYVDDLMFVFPSLKIDMDAIAPINNFLNRYFVKRELLSYKIYSEPHPTDIFFAAVNNANTHHKIFLNENRDVVIPKGFIKYGDELEYKKGIAAKIEFTFSKLSNLTIQSEKVILHFFDHKESKAALNKFKKRLEEQRSEFRFLPDEEKISGEFDEEAFSLQYNDSINKYRSIKELSEDKYGASKFLAKKIFAINYGDEEIDEETDQQILTFFKGIVGLTFFSLWEKVATYFILTNRFDKLILFKRHLIRSINLINFDNLDNYNIAQVKTKVINDLEEFLKVSIAIPLVLNPSAQFIYSDKDEVNFFVDTKKYAMRIRKSNMFRQALVHIPTINYTQYGNLLNGEINYLKFDHSEINNKQSKDPSQISKDTFAALGINSRLSALSPRYVYFHELNIKNIYQVVISMNLKTKSSFENVIVKEGGSEKKNDGMDLTFNLIDNIPNSTFSDYWQINYEWRTNKKTTELTLKKKYFEIFPKNNCSGANEFHITINGNDKNSSIDKKIAIANVKVHPENYISNIRGRPIVSRERRQELFELLNQSERYKSDVFVMPEVSIPFSWIKLLGYISHKRNIAIVAGLEHWINQHGIAFNFMVTILPIQLDEYTTSIIKIRLKNHYAHDEKELLRGHRLLIPRETLTDYPKSYDLFHWRNVYFSVYNCFELADIMDRALFKSKVDFIIAAEFNKDVNYFSDIAGSWVRDVHCYFIQVNTSQYGDSRLIQPSKSYSKDLIQIKGGINSTILVGELKIESLRNFQLVNYNLQKEEINSGRSDLKPTPPDYNTANVKIRIDNKSFK